MRSVIALALALILSAPAEAQRPMTLMAYAAIFRDNYTAVVAAPFGGVQYVDGGTSAQMLGTLRAQRADPQIDVVIMDITTARIACAEGLVERLSPADFPVFAELAPLAREAGGECGPAVTFDHLVMVYDTRAVPTPPAGFAALTDPAHRGRVALAAPPNIQGLAMTAILAHAGSGNWRDIGAAMPTLRQLGQNAQTFNPTPDGYTMILADQVRFATGWNARAQLYQDQSQGRIGVVMPIEGTAFQINTINIVARGPNRPRAAEFVRHALSAPVQAAFTERMFYGPTNERAVVSEAAMNRTALAPQFRQRVIPVDWAEMVTIREAWNQRWRREVIAASGR